MDSEHRKALGRRRIHEWTSPQHWDELRKSISVKVRKRNRKSASKQRAFMQSANPLAFKPVKKASHSTDVLAQHDPRFERLK